MGGALCPIHPAFKAFTETTLPVLYITIRATIAPIIRFQLIFHSLCIYFHTKLRMWFFRSREYVGPIYTSWGTRYSDWLRAGRSLDRIPVGARFSAPVQTGPEAHPASYTVGTGSFPGLKWPERGVDHLPPSNAEVKERVELYLYSPCGPSWPVIGWALVYPLLKYAVT